ncbi:DNA recombination protein RmuC [Arthrobacter sp. H14]|uniref:DNA recombination protein RmuC n=1 Tax=Arthrobacter sp. H14 TaxID=1312959 RepID=UPI00047D4E10|nr:DNA recombination protein RmuC [Arthrobacter sp. H14]
MNGFEILLVVLMLIIGALAGAGTSAVPYRRRVSGLETELDDVSHRLGEARSQLAAAEAERRLLTSQNAQLAAQGQQDSSVLKALAPVAEKLNHMQSQVSVLERDRVEQFGQLAQQLKDAKSADEQLLLTTQSLSSALRSNSARGRWGEVQLHRVVEAAGMLPYVDFTEQVHNVTADAVTRPDMVIRLPGDKEIVVDAKVPLSAYLKAHEISAAASETEQARRKNLLAQHAKAVRAHVDTLAQKKYWDGCANSPELVVCFIPVESFLASALDADPELLEYSFRKNVALASPVSLLAMLKAVAFTWRQDVLTDNAKELFELSRQLYDRLGTMGDHVTKLGSSLKSSVERYNSFVGTLESRVFPTARRINAIDPSTFTENAQKAPPLESTPRLLGAPELLEYQDRQERLRLDVDDEERSA